MILFKIDWPLLTARVIAISANVVHKFKSASESLKDLKSWVPRLPKPSKPYEDKAHSETPAGMIENSLDPMKLDPSRHIKMKTVDDYVNEAVKEEAKKTTEEIVEAVKEAVKEEPPSQEYLDNLANQASDMIRAAKEAQQKK